MSEITAIVEQRTEGIYHDPSGYGRVVITRSDGVEIATPDMPIEDATTLATRINDYGAVKAQRDEAAEMLTKIKERLDKTGYLLGGSMDQDLAQICSYLATVDKESKDANS